MSREWQATALVLTATFLAASIGTWAALPLGLAAVNVVWFGRYLTTWLLGSDE